MKVLDVKSVQSGIDYTITDITELRAQIEPIQRAVRDFHSLDEDLKGRAGSAIRAFYQDTHELFLIFLHQSLTDYENLLNEMKDAISTYEPNESGYVSQAYIENDVVEGFDKVKTQVTELTNDANSIIDNINDLVAIPEFDESTVMDDIQNGQKKAKDIVEELNILDEFEASQLEETKDDIQTMQTFLSNIESKFKSGDISIANYDVTSIRGLEAYKIIQNTIYNQEDEASTGLSVDNIDKLPISEIEKYNNEELDKLAEGGQDILQMAFNDLKKGEIDRQEYLNILNGIKKFDEDVEKGNPEIDISTKLIDYLDNKGQVASDIADVAGKTTDVAMSAFGMYKAYGLHKQGFEITSYTTKGGRVRFRVHNPELIGISKPTKRDTKIYDREYVRDQVKRKNGDNVRIADRVNVRAGAISELKSRAGWLGVAIDTGLNVKDNIMDGESTSRIIGDAGVDVGIGAVSLAAGGVAASAVVGTLGAPVIVGAAVAIGAGYLVSKVTDIKIGDKKISQHMKDGVQGAIKTVAGWFK